MQAFSDPSVAGSEDADADLRGRPVRRGVRPSAAARAAPHRRGVRPRCGGAPAGRDGVADRGVRAWHPVGDLWIRAGPPRGMVAGQPLGWRRSGSRPGLAADPNAGALPRLLPGSVPAGLRLGAAAPARLVQPLRPEIAGSSTAALPGRHRCARCRGRSCTSRSAPSPIFNQLATFDVLLEAVAAEDLDVVVTIGANNDPDALLRPVQRAGPPVAATAPAAGLSAMQWCATVARGRRSPRCTPAFRSSSSRRAPTSSRTRSPARRQARRRSSAPRCSTRRRCATRCWPSSARRAPARTAAQGLAREIAAMPAADDAVRVIETLAPSPT